ncbi:MAG: processing protein [Frankiales bacterium]|nr:processing protein [Frankiales bacterium]
MIAVNQQLEQAALLALLRDLKRGWGEVADAVEEAGSAYAVLDHQLNTGQVDLFASPEDLDVQLAATEKEIAQWTNEDMRLVTLLDPDYPQQLRMIHQRPPFLLYRGRLDPTDATGVAVVGTREATSQGIERAGEIASGLAERGVPVISGLARGIDAAAHQGALDAGGRTVAVIGTGLRRAYPKENADLQERLSRDHLVLSQFWPDSPPTKHSFPMRNAVMSGYAAATVVVEAGARSGAKMQARLALEHGRPVFLLDSLLAHDWAKEFAQRPGTHVVADTDDVLAALEDVLTPVGELVLA